MRKIKIFFAKWSENLLVEGFLNHFRKEWVEKNNGWYEGFTDGDIPSTDNGLEAENRVVKDNHTLRERMPISQYLINAYNMIRDWSLDRFAKNQKTEKPFWDSPGISKVSWEMAYNFLYKGQALIFKSRDYFVCCKKIIKIGQV